nr:ribonuclease H-like domain-containing protein [Tanacetum cinerariifolium]
MQVNVQFLQQLQPEWSRFVMIVKQQHKLDEVSYHKLFDILKQYQKEVNELRAERLARDAKPLTLVATAQANQDPYYQTSKSHKSYAPSSKPSIPTRSHTTTRYKGKEIAKPITPPSEIASKEDSDPEQAQRDKDMQKNLALIAKYFKKIYKPTNNNLRTSSNSRNKNVDTTPRFKNDNKSGQFGNQRTVNVAGARKPKWVKDSVYHKEKMLLCKQAEQGVPLQAKQYDWLADTDEEVNKQELEAHYSYVAKIQETCLMPLATKTQNDSFTFVHELKQEMHANLKYVESLEKDIDELESDKAEFSNMYDVILHECVSKDVMCSYLLSLSYLDALDELQCLYIHKVKECDCLAQKLSKQTESVSKEVYNELLKHTVCNEKASNVFQKEHEQYFKIQDLKAQLQDKNIAISELKKLIEKGKGKYVDTMFDKPFVVRQPNAQRIPKPSVLGVNHKPTISRLHHKRNQLKDKVLPNNSQVKAKTTQVEVHLKIPSVSNKMKSVTACKDSLDSRTLNANAVCAICSKCLVDSNHFACVTKMLNDMNARSKKPNVVPISTRKPKSQANISVATSHKKKAVSSQLRPHQLAFKEGYLDWSDKVEICSKGRPNLLHIDLCCPMRVASINGKKYILVIVDNYSRYTWTLFLHSKDETPEVLKGIEHQTSTALTPEQNGVVERRNHTLVEAAQTMLSA